MSILGYLKEKLGEMAFFFFFFSFPFVELLRLISSFRSSLHYHNFKKQKTLPLTAALVLLYTGMWYSQQNTMKALLTGRPLPHSTGIPWMWAPIVTWLETWLQQSGKGEEEE